MSATANSAQINADKLYKLLEKFCQHDWNCHNPAEQVNIKEARAEITTFLQQEKNIDPNYVSPAGMPLFLYAIVVNLPTVAKHIYAMKDFKHKNSLDTLIYQPDGIKHNALHLLCMTKTTSQEEKEAAVSLLKECLQCKNINTTPQDGRSALELALCWLTEDLFSSFSGQFKAHGIDDLRQLLGSEPYWAKVLRYNRYQQLLYKFGQESSQFSYDKLMQVSSYFEKNFFQTIFQDVQILQREDVATYRELVLSHKDKLRQDMQFPFKVLRSLLASCKYEITFAQAQPNIELLEEVFPAFFQDSIDYTKVYSKDRPSIKDELVAFRAKPKMR